MHGPAARPRVGRTAHPRSQEDTVPALDGKKIAFLVTNGYEDSELTSPWEAVTDAGAQAVLVSPETGSIAGKKGHEATVDEAVASADPAGFDALVLPGGVVNADKIRM